MRIFRFVTISAALFLVHLQMSAQNINPTVEVSREYQGKLMEVHKPAMEMAVPDSLLKFDLDFDYSVFESPYKGSYEFNPYIMSMRPDVTAIKPGRFYLKAGAGYSLHPDMDVIWSPVMKKGLTADVYASHDSYIGKYHDLNTQGKGQSDQVWSGHDLKSVAGAALHYDRKNSVFGVEASYYGLAQKNLYRNRNYDALDLSFTAYSKKSWPNSLYYALNVDYRFAEDKLKSEVFNPGYMSEHNFDVDFRLGPVTGTEHNFLVDMGLELDSYTHAIHASIGQFTLVPHYVFNKGGLRLDAGVRLAFMIHPEGAVTAYQTKEQYFYPDIKVQYSLIPDAMRAYAHIRGGSRINTYSSILERNHQFDFLSAPVYGSILDTDIDRINISLGLAGRLYYFMNYDFRAGYVNSKNGILDAVVYSQELDALLPSVGYAPYQKFYTSFESAVELENLRIDAGFVYTHTWDLNKVNGLFAPPSFIGEISALYNCFDRIFAGINLDFATGRIGSVKNYIVDTNSNTTLIHIPGYTDLGLYLEYSSNRKLSFWAKAGNLLGMQIQNNLLYAEKGAYFTVGICLNLQ